MTIYISFPLAIEASPASIIELPGLIENTDRAIACINWVDYENAFAESQLSNSKSEIHGKVSLKILKDNHPFSHPIIGSIVLYPQPVKDPHFLILKVVKSYSGQVLKVTISGFSNSICLFRDLSDFSYLPQIDPNPLTNSLASLANEPMTLTPSTCESLSSILASTENKGVNDFLFSPPFFTLNSIPHPFKFQHSSVVCKENLSPSYHPRSKKTIFYYCSLDDDTRPTHLASCSEHFFSEYRPKIADHLYDELVEIFNQRPIWTTLALKNTLQRSISLRRELPLVAFYYPKGPWRHCWVKYGVAPHLDPKMRIYQIFEIRCFTASPTFTTGEERIEDFPQSHLIEAGRLPCTQGNVIFQFCDVKDSDLRTILDSESSLIPVEHPCCSRDGWYRSSCKPKLLAMLKLKWKPFVKEYPLRAGGGSLRLSGQPNPKLNQLTPSTILPEKDKLQSYPFNDSDSSYSVFEEDEDDLDDFYL